ncbi:hypothetical protein B0T18DRAFT_418216 [Schizothecium vesticola]|uniref:Chorismate synthase protein n=1 Tax=Schizothecium vesticola TaxID=314040 RepID=A0AA40EJM2_9PEZI|nr:hypothetical protein B0T18DRAFT_418216 [Schizothecium vesticola]
MAIPWGTIKSLLIFFGPVLLPKAIAYYRAIRNAPRLHNRPIRPAPPSVSRALLLLFVVALLFLVRTLPLLSPENIFSLTQSRLQIPVDVLFNRLAALRPLTPPDLALRARFVNLESRLLYLQFGPDVLASCPFCTSDDPSSFLYYALPDLVAPHLLNLFVLTLATAAPSGGAGWRVPAAVAAAVIAAADVYLVGSYNYQANARALRLPDVDAFFWTARAWRFVGLAALDGLVGWALWLSATNRAFAAPPSAAERVEGAVRALAGVKGKLNAAGVVKNTVIRDEELRGRGTAYWAHEGRLMRDVMEDREVLEGMNDALENRIDIRTVEMDAEAYAASVLRPGLQGGM